MKFIKSLAFVLFASAVLVACGGGSKPEVVAKEFTQALTRLDMEAAKKLCTKKSGAMLDMINGIMANAPEEEIKKQKEDAKNIKIETTGTKIAEDGKSAVVDFKMVSADGTSQEQKYDLVKEDGGWKVDFKMDGLN